METQEEAEEEEEQQHLVDPDGDTAAMAAAMGFSSFGTQDDGRPRASKKRRFDGGGGAPPHPPPSAATSANAVALGDRTNRVAIPPIAATTTARPSSQLPLHPAKRRKSKKSSGEGANADEIDLDDDDDDDGDDRGGEEKAGYDSDDPEQKYIDPPRSLGREEPPGQAISRSGADSGALGGGTGGHRARGGRGGGGRRGGWEVPRWISNYNSDWPTGGVDLASNENPWGRLEKAKGLEEARGSWLRRPRAPIE